MSYKQLADWKRKQKDVETRVRTLQNRLAKTHAFVEEKGDHRLYHSLVQKSRNRLAILRDHEHQELRETQRELQDIRQKIDQLELQTNKHALHGTFVKVSFVLMILGILAAVPFYLESTGSKDVTFLEGVLSDITGGINIITGAAIGTPPGRDIIPLECTRAFQCDEQCGEEGYQWNGMGDCMKVGCGETCSGSSSTSTSTSSSTGGGGGGNDSCGTISDNVFMNASVSDSATCYTPSANHITIDCQGFTITYGTGGGTVFGVDNSGSFSNVSIRNCIIVDGSESGVSKSGIYLKGGNDGAISNNTIYTKNAESHGITLDTSSDNRFITNNTINTSGQGAHGIYVNSSDGGNFTHNNITTLGDQSDGIRLTPGSGNNIFFNNTITKGTGNVFNDLTGDSETNYLVYNTSDGEVRWVNDSNGGTLKNLTFNITNDQGFGWGRNLVIALNLVSLNSSALVNSNLNAAANITMQGLVAGTINHIMKHPDHGETIGTTRINGTSCIDSATCEKQSYVGGVLIFNTTGFSGFGPNDVPAVTGLGLNTTNVLTNDSNENITANWTSTDTDGDRVRNISTWYRNGTPILAVHMPFERINGSNANNWWDYSGFENMGSEGGSILWNGTLGFDGGGVYEFDGSDDVITILDDDSQDITNGITLSAWVRPTAIGGGDWETIIMKGSDQTLSNQGFSYNLRLDDNGVPEFSVNTTDGRNTLAAASALTNGKWYHIAGTYNQTESRIYVDGTLNTSATHTGTITVTSSNIRIGHINNDQFSGRIDEVMIWNHSISSEQVYNLFANRTWQIAANDSGPGENWSISVTPNDGIEDGAEVMSVNQTTEVVASNTAPSIPALVSPANATNLVNRTPTLVWNLSTDADSDPITYNLLVDDSSTFNNLEVNVTGITNNTETNVTFNLSTILDVDTTYFWKVRANDSTEYGTFSGIGNFTIDSFLSITVIDDTVDFGDTFNNDKKNTTSGDPGPFWVENTGNIFMNITLNATQMFTKAVFPDRSYQFKIAENDTGAFNVTLSQTD